MSLSIEPQSTGSAGVVSVLNTMSSKYVVAFDHCNFINNRASLSGIVNHVFMVLPYLLYLSIFFIRFRDGCDTGLCLSS